MRTSRRSSSAARSTTSGSRSPRPRASRTDSPRVVMLARRIIPCLDVKDGRVVKGINFVAAARRRRSGRAGGGVRRAGRRRDLLPRHLRVARGPLDARRRRRAHRGSGVHAADRRRRRALGRRCRAPARCRRRQDRDQHRRDPHARADHRSCATRFGSQAIVVAVDAKRRATQRLGGVQPRRPHARGPRRARVVHARRRSRRRRDPADQHGSRRHRHGLRHRARSRRSRRPSRSR